MESGQLPRGGLFDMLPVYCAFILLVLGGIVLLEKAERQARDTIRKHHIEDIEYSLYALRARYGTYPPYNQLSWCGILSDPANQSVRDSIETSLREQIEKYSNSQKPFPADPLYQESKKDYFYWKRSPSVFELYATLEARPTEERSTIQCETAQGHAYDYGITSSLRENRPRSVPL